MSRNSSQRLIVWGSVESIWPPFTMLAYSGVDFGTASINAGHCGPVCSSCRAPERKTGHLDVARPVAHGPADRRARGGDPAPSPAPPAAARPGWPGSLTGCGAPGWPGRSTRCRRWRPARRRSRSRSTAGRRWRRASADRWISWPFAVGGRRLGVVDARVDPAGREPVVVDAARDSRSRRDRRWGSSGRWRRGPVGRCRRPGTATGPR